MVCHAPFSCCPKHLVDALERAVDALPASWLSPSKQVKSSPLLLTASSASEVIALRKAPTSFGLEERLRQRLGRALAVSFTGKKQGTNESSRITLRVVT